MQQSEPKPQSVQLSRGAVLFPEFSRPPSSLHLPSKLTLSCLPRQAQHTTDGPAGCTQKGTNDVGEPFSLTWIQANGKLDLQALRGKRAGGAQNHLAQEQQHCRVQGGADPFTQSGEKDTERDHHVCKGPRVASLVEKRKNQSNYPRQGKMPL